MTDNSDQPGALITRTLNEKTTRQGLLYEIYLCIIYNIFLLTLVQGCHGRGKLGEKRKLFKVREKAGNFLKIQVRENL